MRILLIGEYSNVHWTLAEGLNKIGHQAVVASGGDGWKNYSRHIDFNFKNRLDVYKFLATLPFNNKFKGNDVVQFINFRFLFEEKQDYLNKLLFNFFKKYNNKTFLGAFGDDYFWVKSCIDKQFKYTQFDFIDKKDDKHLSQVLQLLSASSKELNTFIANQSNRIIAGLYEYYMAYHHQPYQNKLSFIPFPINTDKFKYSENKVSNGLIKIFIGIQENRIKWKGIDVLLKVLRDFAQKYPSDIELVEVSNVPFEKYTALYESCNVLVDQLYSYSPAINALTAMAKGKIILGGGESEMYQLYQEKENFPVLNVIPDENQISAQLEYLLANKSNFVEMGYNSASFVGKHHNYIDVAKQYEKLYLS